MWCQVLHIQYGNIHFWNMQACLNLIVNEVIYDFKYLCLTIIATQHMTFRNGYRWSFSVQNPRSLCSAPVATSRTILHCNSYVALITVRLVFSCSSPTVGINWSTYIPWDLSQQQPKHMRYYMHTWSLTWTSNKLWAWKRKVHSCNEESSLYLWNSGWKRLPGKTSFLQM